MDKIVQLTWATDKANDIQEFEIEKSRDGFDFGSLKSFNIDPSNQAFRYFKHFDIDGGNDNLYYRIKMLNRNNTITFSPIRKVLAVNIAGPYINLFPNPVNNQLNIAYESRTSQNISIFLFKADGNLIKSMVHRISPKNNVISLTVNDVETGIYMVKVIDEYGKVTNKKVYKK